MVTPDDPSRARHSTAGRERGRSPHLRRLLTLLGLWALAVAQPILDLAGRQPEYLLDHRVEGSAVVLFALLLTALVPLLLGAILAVVSLVSRRVAAALHAILCATLLAALALELLRRLPLPDGVLVGLAAVAALGTVA